MSQVTIYGPAVSSYVRTARWACAEKGVEHTLAEYEEGLHPYNKFPVMKHAGLTLPETSAIVHYLDAAFDGPDLIPTDASERGRAEKWVSFINCYMYKHLVPNYALKYVFGGDSPDRSAIEAALDDMNRDLALLDEGLAGKEWFAGGNAISIADLFIAPIVATVGMFPEGAAAIESKQNLKALMTRVGSRDAYKAIQPTS